jgi:hypothetical protein
MPASSITYPPNGTAYFEVPFSYSSIEDLKVYLNSVLTTYWSISGTTLTIEDNVGNPSVPTESVTIKRETDVTEPVTTFSDGSVYIAEGLNNQVNQLLYAIEEVNDRLDNLPAGGGGGGGASNVPNATAGNQFIASSPTGAHSWTLKSVADVQSLLGISGANSLPAAVADRFLTTQVGSATYELQTPATVKTRLGIGASIPTPNNQPNFFMTVSNAGNAYQLTSVETTKSTLGLGSAAYRNTGTASGNIPLLIAPAAGNVGALPIISGENLTNVAKPLKFMCYTVWADVGSGTARLLPNGDAGQGDVTPWLGVTTSATISETVGYQNALAGDPWVSTTGLSPNTWRLRDAGVYYITVEQIVSRLSNEAGAAERLRLRIHPTDNNKLVLPNQLHHGWTETKFVFLPATTGALTTLYGTWTIETFANFDFTFQVRRSTNSGQEPLLHITTPATSPATAPENVGCVVKIWKIK